MAQIFCKIEKGVTTFRSYFQNEGLVYCKRRLVCEELTARFCNFVGHFQNRVGRKINCEGRKINCKGRNSENIGQNRVEFPIFRHKNAFLRKIVRFFPKNTL